MKMILVAFALVALAVAAPPSPPSPPGAVIQILRSSNEQTPDGGYNFAFETENGISRVENGELKEAVDEENKPHQVVVVRGSYGYTDNEGKSETVNYFADETGFHAEGDSIPKPQTRR